MHALYAVYIYYMHIETYVLEFYYIAYRYSFKKNDMTYNHKMIIFIYVFILYTCICIMYIYILYNML